MRKFLFLILVTAPLIANAFAMNDLTILLPLPAPAEMNEMLQPANSGEKGILLPGPAYGRLPRLLDDEKVADIYNLMLRLIAIRLDPCFVEGQGPMACKRQIRMVWQPLYDYDGEIVARDAAIHTFYEFSESEWPLVLAAWKTLPPTELTEPLQIHSILRDEGYHGAYWQNLKKILLRFCGQKNLTRATAMNVMNGEQMWVFAGIDITPEQMTAIQIPRIGRNVQGIIMGTSNTDEFTGSLRPAPTQDPVLEGLLQDSIGMKQNERELKELLHRIQAMQNPKLNNPGTLDCASCHVAQSVHEWAKAHFANWDWQNDFQKETYVSHLDLTNTSERPYKANHFRALGYFHNRAMISQRVINETADTTALMNQRQPHK